MRDDPIPPRSSDDEEPLPVPDEHGFGFYPVEEYSGDPSARRIFDDREPFDDPPPVDDREPFEDPPSSAESLGRRPVLFDDREPFEDPPSSGEPLGRRPVLYDDREPFEDPRPLDDLQSVDHRPAVGKSAAGRRRERPDEQPLAFAPPPPPFEQVRARSGPESRAQRDPFGEPPAAEGKADVVDDVARVRAGRVPFAERNWRLPTIAVLVGALVVLGVVILLLPDSGSDDPQDSTAVVELRAQPIKQWDEDLDGFSSALVSDESSLYTVVAKQNVTEMVALDLAGGDERWSVELGLGGSDASGSAAFVDDVIAVAISGATLPDGVGDGLFAVIDPDSGTVAWQVPLEGSSPTIESEAFVSAVDPRGGFIIRSIDVPAEELGPPMRVNAFFVVDDTVYFDTDGVLSRAQLPSLEVEVGFRYRHAGVIAAQVAIGDDIAIAVDEQIVRIGEDGSDKYSYDPGVGTIRSLFPMRGDAVLVGGSAQMRVVALDDAEASAITVVRSGVEPVLVQDIDGDEHIVVFDGVDRGVAAGTIRTMRVVDDDLEEVSQFDLTTSDGAPPIVASGATLYTSSLGTEQRFVAFDPSNARRLWSLPFAFDDQPVFGPAGLILITREDDESVVAYYAAEEETAD